MASQKELIAVVAEQTGVAYETVVVIDRLLAAAGLRTRALRGRGNTPMTYSDAANLIIATALDSNPKDAVPLVKAYTALQAIRVKERAIAPGGLGATFGAALANMIEGVASERVAFSAADDAPGHKAATVHLYGPVPRADIVLVSEGEALTFQYGSIFDEGRGDLRRSVRFTQVTLGFVGEAVAEGFSK